MSSHPIIYDLMDCIVLQAQRGLRFGQPFSVFAATKSLVDVLYLPASKLLAKGLLEKQCLQRNRLRLQKLNFD
jgi:hypothetical protein